MVPTAEQFDLVVIGGGTGGYGTALYAASAGLSVALVERDKIGGTCLNRGCIPAKAFLESAAVFRHVAGAEEFGVKVDSPVVDFAQTQRRKQEVVDGIVKGLQGVLKARKITIVHGTATVHDAHTVRVDDGSELKGTNIVLATGSVPRTIPGFEPDGETVFTSDEFLMLDHLPATAAVIGGGAIGCEFASTMADLGTSVTILEGLDKILPGCDADIAGMVSRSFRKRDIEVKTGVKITGHEPGDGGTSVQMEGADPLKVDAVVVSIGRKPVTDGLGLEAAGVDVDERGFIPVDEHLRTSLDGVYAVGDVVSVEGVVHPQLAHVSFAEAIHVVKHILGENPLPIDYGKVPWCIYCHPEVAFAGHSEQSAIDAGYEVVVSKHQFRANSRARIVGDLEGMVKVIAEKRPDGTAGTILGVHMVGPWVTEQLGQGYLAVNWEATVDEVAAFIQPHPTMSELFGETVLSLTGRGLHG